MTASLTRPEIRSPRQNSPYAEGANSQRPGTQLPNNLRPAPLGQPSPRRVPLRQNPSRQNPSRPVRGNNPLGLPSQADQLTDRASFDNRGAWITWANCRDIDPDALFVKGAAQRKAVAVCRHCPVVLQCRADALDNRVEFGVWGGMTERQRRAVLRKHPDVTSWADIFSEQIQHRRALAAATRDAS